MSQITTHVLDIQSGNPAIGLDITLSKLEGNEFIQLETGTTDSDGRISDLLSSDFVLVPGIYKMFFHIGPYFEKIGVETFYPYAEITFQISNIERHYHIPLLLSPFGFTTYRGS